MCVSVYVCECMNHHNLVCRYMYISVYNSVQYANDPPHTTDLYELHIRLILSLGWSVVHSTAGECILCISHHVGGVEIREDVHQTSPVPVVCDSTSVVTLASHVGERVKRD